MDDPSTMRILTADLGASWNTVVYELISEDLAANREGWEEWMARPDTPEFMEHWLQIVDDWAGTIWNIEE
jgi:hypothetical protein